MDAVTVCVERLRRVGSASIIQHVAAAAAHATLPEETEGANESGGRGRDSAVSDWRLVTGAVLPYFPLHRFIGSVPPRFAGL